MFSFREPFELNKLTFSAWPLRSQQACEYDGEYFDTVPIPRVLSYNSNKQSFLVSGCFCSVNCCKAFTLRLPHCTIDDMVLNEHISMVYFHVSRAKPAHSLYKLKKHGGELDIEEWRKSFACVHKLKNSKTASKKQTELPHKIYTKNVKAEALIFGRCNNEEDTKTGKQTYGLQQYLIDV